MNALTYTPRLVISLPEATAVGRRYKTYAIVAEPGWSSDLPDTQWFSAQATKVLPDTLKEADHPVGFVILHLGMDGDYLLVSQWYDANMIRHRVRGAPKGGSSFHPLDQSDLAACVWELEIIKFERDAWVNTVLAAGRIDQISIDAYLATTFSGWV